jgi:transcriptional regulator with XRE-family HTH domain
MPKPRPTLQSLIEEIGLTQKQLATLVGVTPTTVWRWYHGEARPRPLSVGKLHDLARAYGMAQRMTRALAHLDELLATAKR